MRNKSFHDNTAEYPHWIQDHFEKFCTKLNRTEGTIHYEIGGETKNVFEFRKNKKS